MITTLFLHSEIENPYNLYKTMLAQNPVYWDEQNQIWAIYSYDDCVTVLKSPFAYIPEINPNNEQGLNRCAFQISDQLARLSNGIQHDIAREVAALLFSKMSAVATNKILGPLIENGKNNSELDWVNSVCKQLPVKVVLKSFGFSDKDSLFISGNIETLTKIMLPIKTKEQIESINAIAKEVYIIAEKQLVDSDFYGILEKTLSKKHQRDSIEILSLCVSNLIGLFIQSYDAGRGLLSNALLQILNKNHDLLQDNIQGEWIQNAVVETLRFDPPIHTTRRVAVEDIILKDRIVKKGDKILLVLAAANRDAKHFSNPETFNVTRINNGEHLTFGIGGHECLAKYLSIRIATNAIAYLLEKYKSVSVLHNKIEYEPLLNARLPKNSIISIN